MPTPQTQAGPSSEEIDVEANHGIQADLNDPVVQRAGRRGSHSNLPAASERLVVTSQLHPFWSTKKGLCVVALVVAAVVGGIVGGVLGGRSNNGPPKSPSSTTTSSTTTSMTGSNSSFSPTSTTLNDTPITAAELFPTITAFSSSFSPLNAARNVRRTAERALLATPITGAANGV